MIYGVDVSEWQGDLDWRALRAAGVEFAFIRLGDGIHIDASSAAHRAAAVSHGIKVAPYYFCRNREDPIVQADRYVRLAAQIGEWDGPLIPDYEQGSLQGANVRAWIEATVSHLEGIYRRPILYYTGWYILRDSIGMTPVLQRNLLWMPGGPAYNVASGISSSPNNTTLDSPPGYWIAAQQWTQYGTVAGYTPLDLNVMHEAAYADFFRVDFPSVDVPVQKRNPRAELIAIASSQDGNKENPPKSNSIIYWDWWENGNGVVEAWEIWGAWCASYISWVYDQAGLALPPIQRDRGGFMGVPAGVLYAFQRGEAFRDNPLPGDIALYSWYPIVWDKGLPWVWYVNPRTGAAGWEIAGDHCGIFSHMSGDRFMCWEGNTSVSGSQDNGGMVALRDRTADQIVCFWRPAVLTAAEAGTYTPSRLALSEDDDDMAMLALQDALRRPNRFTHDGRAYYVWDFNWLPENGRIIQGPSGARAVQWTAVAVALVEPGDSAAGPVPVFVYDEGGLVGMMNLDNRSQLYYPRHPGRQSFACVNELMVQGRECLMPA